MRAERCITMDILAWWNNPLTNPINAAINWIILAIVPHGYLT